MNEFIVTRVVSIFSLVASVERNTEYFDKNLWIH